MSWLTRTIGNGTIPGGIVDNGGGAYTISGSGGDYWTTADNYEQVYWDTPYSGDFEFVMRVDSIPDIGEPNSKAGLELRNTTATSSERFAITVSPNGNCTVSHRPNDGDWVDHGLVVVAFPVYIKLERVGSTMAGYHSTDGQNWTWIDPSSGDIKNYPTTQAVYGSSTTVAMVVSAHDPDKLATAEVSEISAEFIPQAPGQSGDVYKHNFTGGQDDGWAVNRSTGCYAKQSDSETKYFEPNTAAFSRYGLQLEAEGDNKLPDPDNMLSGWSGDGAPTISKHATIRAPDGSLNALHIRDIVLGTSYHQAPGALTAGDSTAVWARTVSGTGNMKLLFQFNDNSGGEVELTEEWQQVEGWRGATDDFLAFDARWAGADLTELLVWAPQAEETAFNTSTMAGNVGVNRGASYAKKTVVDMGLRSDITTDFSILVKAYIVPPAGTLPGNNSHLLSFNYDSNSCVRLHSHSNGDLRMLFRTSAGGSPVNYTVFDTASTHGAGWADIRVSISPDAAFVFVNGVSQSTTVPPDPLGTAVDKMELGTHLASLGQFVHWEHIESLVVADYAMDEDELRDYTLPSAGGGGTALDLRMRLRI